MAALCPGQNPVVLAAVHKIFELTNKRGVLVVDRGFDGWVMFEDWLDNTYHFVARLVGERHLLRFYIRRWECEEAIRFLKSQVQLEKIRTFRWSAIHRLVLLAVLVMIYLGWLLEAHPHICDRLISLSQPLPDNPDFLSYRLLGGLIEVINTCFWLHKDLLKKSLG